MGRRLGLLPSSRSRSNPAAPSSPTATSHLSAEARLGGGGGGGAGGWSLRAGGLPRGGEEEAREGEVGTGCGPVVPGN
ncbi:PREDICTED: POU domain, class 4, transcription factor 2-like [Charadrius vociferus]|uniref:POU domain, class 4, transcription factor 2-like n=1 Tax=Charadrius vociferus TaxID=50402 RepID=UPI0005213834|nr:PREDICTED: POU domain, class 4, transcription factor 2-like [Charadrius vociferus]